MHQTSFSDQSAGPNSNPNLSMPVIISEISNYEEDWILFVYLVTQGEKLAGKIDENPCRYPDHLVYRVQ